MAEFDNFDAEGWQRPYTPDWQQKIQPVGPQYTGQPIGGQQPQAGQQQAPQSGGQPFTQSNDWTPDYLNSYFQSRGATPAAGSIDYWLSKKGELDARGQQLGDPNYANMRLQYADEFGGPDYMGNARGMGGGGGMFGSMIGSQFGVAGNQGGRANSLYDLLMQRAGQSLVIDRNDPVLRSQVDAFDAMQQRASRNYLADVAERQGANANIGAERRLAAERTGQASSALEAQLMQRLQDARRQEIQSALSGAQGFLTNQQQLALQQELANLGLAQRAYEFDANQAFQMSPFGSNF